MIFSLVVKMILRILMSHTKVPRFEPRPCSRTLWVITQVMAPSNWVPATHLEELDGIPGFCLQPGSATAVADM